MKILVAEDDPTLCQAYEKMFSHADGKSEVFLAQNGQEAIDLIDAESPNLILLDLMMPEIDGFGVLEYLNETGKIETTTVFILTNLATDEDREKAMDLGATDYIVKSNVSADMVKQLLKG